MCSIRITVAGQPKLKDYRDHIPTARTTNFDELMNISQTDIVNAYYYTDAYLESHSLNEEVCRTAQI